MYGIQVNAALMDVSPSEEELNSDYGDIIRLDYNRDHNDVIDEYIRDRFIFDYINWDHNAFWVINNHGGIVYRHFSTLICNSDKHCVLELIGRSNITGKLFVESKPKMDTTYLTEGEKEYLDIGIANIYGFKGDHTCRVGSKKVPIMVTTKSARKV